MSWKESAWTGLWLFVGVAGASIICFGVLRAMNEQPQQYSVEITPQESPDFVGRWVNTEPMSEHLTRLEVFDGSVQFYRAWGDGERASRRVPLVTFARTDPVTITTISGIDYALAVDHHDPVQMRYSVIKEIDGQLIVATAFHVYESDNYMYAEVFEPFDGDEWADAEPDPSWQDKVEQLLSNPQECE